MINNKLRLSGLNVQTAMSVQCLRRPDGKTWRISTNLETAGLNWLASRWQQRSLSHSRRSFINYINLYSQFGFAAQLPLDELPPDHIRRIEGVSNSQLSRFLRQQIGLEKQRYPARCLVFGSAFHAVVLESKPLGHPDWNLRPTEWRAITEMQANYNNMLRVLYTKADNAALRHARRESVNSWTDPRTGLRCKAKLDLYVPNFAIADFKTTSAPSLQAFEQRLLQYDYDRQAAFYLGGTNAAWFFAIGVQKQPPFQTFILQHHRNSRFIQNGRRKADFLLKKWQAIQY